MTSTNVSNTKRLSTFHQTRKITIPGSGHSGAAAGTTLRTSAQTSTRRRSNQRSTRDGTIEVAEATTAGLGPAKVISKKKTHQRKATGAVVISTAAALGLAVIDASAGAKLDSEVPKTNLPTSGCKKKKNKNNTSKCKRKCLKTKTLWDSSRQVNVKLTARKFRRARTQPNWIF